MILNSLDTQFKLGIDGKITWQRDLTNPMPGEVVAQILKGDAPLMPVCSLTEADCLKDEDKDAVKGFIQKWLESHIQTILEPLFRLKMEDVPAGAPHDICDVLYNGLGVIKRGDIQSQIDQMDEDQRTILRTKKIRFGPLLVYLPELNKPAAVRLRALLLSVWENKALPAEVPADGIVSFSVEGKTLDTGYYQSIGYPIYGPRVIRVDMLDRVICAVYDSAKDGKFMAQHKMAEWLGSNIADLYAILEAMGHKKIHDPADDILDADTEKKPAVEAQSDEAQAELTATELASKEDTMQASQEDKKPENIEKPAVTADEAKPEEVKPDLAIFALKKGKAIGGATDKRPQANSNKPSNKFKNQNFKSDKKSHKKKSKPQPQGQRIYKAEAQSNPDDNPFAVLQQLKAKD